MAITIAAPAVDDAAAISTVAETSFQATFSGYPADDLAAFLDSWMPVDKVRRQINDPTFAYQIARDADGICGFIKLCPVDLPLPATEPADDDALELGQLYLLPRAQGTGAAAQLMDWFIDETRRRGARRVYLSVYIDNLRAQAFYRRYGFYEIGKNPFRVGNTIDDDRIWRADI